MAMPLPAKKFIADKRGAVAVISAMLLTVIIGFAALGVDIGVAFTERRKAQSTVDLAAIAAASDVANARRAAAATIERNRRDGGRNHTVELGVYSADAALPADQRFQPSASANANAVRVTMDTSTPLYFGKWLTGKDRLKIQTVATAARSSFATFAIGSRLLKLEGGLLNQVLGGLLDTELSLSVMDYQALVDAQLDLFNYMDALASRIGLTGVTYDSVLDSEVQIGQAVGAMADAESLANGATSSAASALNAVAQSLHTSTRKLKTRSFLDVGPYGSLPLGQHPKVGLSVSALDVLNAAAQIANGQRQVEAALDLKVPGIASVSLKLAIGERPQGTSWVTVGSEGATVHTAQTRVLLTIGLVGAAPVAAVTLPIYIEMASATATLNRVDCDYSRIGGSSVTLGVNTAVVDAWIGNVSDFAFNNFSSAPNPPAATLVDLAPIKVSGRSHFTISNTAAQPVTFDYSDIEHRTKKTVGAKDFTASLLSKLLGDARLTVSIGGLSIVLPQLIQSQVAKVLAQAGLPIDQLLSQVLATLGVGLGQADVWVLGLRCDGAVLVN